MTTDRELDIMQVEAQSVVWTAYQKWLADKLGPRAQGVDNGSNPGIGGRGNLGTEGNVTGGAEGANIPPVD